jgi:hypothetical protein
MKKTFLTLVLTAFALLSFAQPPYYFNYQAVVRDADGKIVAGQDVKFKIEILSGTSTGTVVYRETHEATTSDQGLVTLPIFGGSQDGMWLEIDWSADDYFIKIYLDINGGTDFVEMGTTQLLSVPYAMHAGTVAKEKQELSVSGEQLSISGGNTVDLPDKYNDFTVNGTLVIGAEGRVISEVKEITGTTDATDNYTTIDLPTGYTDSNTHLVSADVLKENATSRIRYGLGYVGTNGTVSYYIAWYQLVPVGQSHYRLRFYYPDELKNMPFRIILLKTGIRIIPL